MALTMKPDCEHCGVVLADDTEAFICSWECTFCTRCAESFGRCCPNCGGELVPRPCRKRAE